MINRERRILLLLQCALDLPCLVQARYFLFRDDLKLCSESLRCCCMAAEMLTESRIEIDTRSNVMAAARSAQNVNPGHYSKCQGGDSNSRPRAYESPALPLSYPGVKAGKLNLIFLSVNARGHATGYYYP